MIVSIHQPNYLPYPGFFNKIKSSDVFVIYDTAQYVKNRWDNRNRIRTKEDWIYLTIPVASKDSFKKAFIDVKLPDNKKWLKKHWLSIFNNYSKSDHFKEHSSYFNEYYNNCNIDSLFEFNLGLINYLIKSFGILVKIYKASELDIDFGKSGTDSLIDIIKSVNGTSYISGPSGLNYIDESRFKKNKIKLNYQNYLTKEYKQCYTGFIPNLSALDLLFNMGSDSNNYL